MPRQFGLRAIPATASGPAAISRKPVDGLRAAMCALIGRVATGSIVAKQQADRPLAPASWRGSAGRRSMSLD